MSNDRDEQIIYIGKTNFREGGKIFGIKNKDRFQHMYIIGQTGTGKSTLLKNLAIQDIEDGRGLAVVDPHGEFVDEILESIPEERLDDVVYFNPIDTEYPIGFNVLEVKNPEHRHLVSSGLMSIFTKIWANVWSARMEYILNYTVLALAETPGTTMLGIPRMLVDKIFRQKVVNNLKDPVVKSFWVQEYEDYEDRFRKEAIAPIQNKVGQFLGTHIIRNVVGQTKSTLDIEKIMNEGKILLVNVSKGKIGEDNSALLGAMLITKIQLAAMERVNLDPEDRRDFLLYVDEFQNFATDSFASVLSEARKYRLGLIVSHQYIGQLTQGTSGDFLRDAIFGNVGTTITFRVGAQDAEFLEKHYAPEITMQDLVNLPNHSVYMRLLVGGIATRPFSAATLPPFKIECPPEMKQKIIDTTRRNYARPRAEVEEEIAHWSGMRPGAAPSAEAVQSAAEAAIGLTATSPSAPRSGDVGSNEKTSEAPRPKPVFIKPKYDTDLSALGIDPGVKMDTYQEVMPSPPEQEASLNQLGSGQIKGFVQHSLAGSAIAKKT